MKRRKEPLPTDQIRVNCSAMCCEAATAVGYQRGKPVSLDPTWQMLGDDLRRWKDLLRPICSGVAALKKSGDEFTAGFARKAIEKGEYRLRKDLLRRHGIHDEQFKNEVLPACN